MATLHWEMRQVLPQLRDSGRLTVLIALILHANVRNRAWPSLDLLVTETDYAKATVNEAKEWLLEHKAIELIKYKDRAGDELELPVRQNVYQLTGSIEIEKKKYRYLYTSHENSLDSSASERSIVERSVSERSVSELEGSTSIKGSSKSKGSTNSKDKKPFTSDDVKQENLNIAALIEAWLKAHHSLDTDAYQKKGYRAKAKLLIQGHITPSDVTDYIQQARATWARSGTVTWENIVTNIQSWKANRTPASNGTSQAEVPLAAEPITDEQRTEMNERLQAIAKKWSMK